MAVRSALSAEDVFDRLKTLEEHVKGRRETTLSKRDIEFLLGYRERMEMFREELSRRTRELDCVKQILSANRDSTEESLQELSKFQIPAALEVASQIHHNTLLLKTLKLALADSLSKSKNGSKMQIPKRKDHTPAFYNIIKENIKKKDLTFNKDLECVTKLWLWVKSAAEKPVKKKATSLERRSESTLMIPPTPATCKTPQHPPTPRAAGNLTYHCHLLLSRHPATSKINSPEYRKMTSLEEKLKFILDDFSCAQQAATQSMTVTQIKPSKPRKETVGQQTQTDADPDPAAVKKNRSSQTSPEPESQPLKESSRERDSLNDDVFLSNSMSKSLSTETTQTDTVQAKLCALCRQRSAKRARSRSNSENERSGQLFSGELSEYDELQNSMNSTGKHIYFDSQISVVSELPRIGTPRLTERYGDSITVETEGLNFSEREDQMAIKHMYQNLRDKKDSSNIPDGRLVRRRGSAPASATRTSSSRETITALIPGRSDNNFRAEMQSRAVSARSAGFSPIKKRTVMMKNADTQTEVVVDPENAPPELLFADDEADEPVGYSYADFRQEGYHGGRQIAHSVPPTAKPRKMSASSVDMVCLKVSQMINPDGQWKRLFTKLMCRSDHHIDLTDEVMFLETNYRTEESQARNALKKWIQAIGGEIDMSLLKESLHELKRSDIVKSISTYEERFTMELDAD